MKKFIFVSTTILFIWFFVSTKTVFAWKENDEPIMYKTYPEDPRPLFLSYMNDVDVDKSGNVYTGVGLYWNIDMYRSSILVYSPDAELLQKIGRYGADEDNLSNRVYGIKVDNKYNIYVCDAANDKVKKYDKDGNFLYSIGESGTGEGQFNGPRDLDIDVNGNLYISDRYNHRVQKFDSDGNFILQWGSNGTADGQFNQPYGVAVDGNGDIWVSEVEGDRIQKFDSSGNHIISAGSTGSGDAQLNSPLMIDTDSEDNVYVVDRNNHRIQKFDSTGNHLINFSEYGFLEHQIERPFGISIHNERIYVGGYGNLAIKIFNTDGEYLDTFGKTDEVAFPSDPLHVVYEKDIYYILDNGSRNVIMLDNNLSQLKTVYPNSTHTYSSNYYASISIIDKIDRVFIYNYHQAQINVFDMDLNYISSFGASGSGPGEFDYVSDVDYFSNNLYISDTRNNRIQIFDLDYNYVDEITGDSSGTETFTNPATFVYDEEYIYILNNSKEVQKYTNEFDFVDKWNITDNGRIIEIDLDGNGNIVATSNDLDEVLCFSTEGEFLYKMSGTGSGRDEFAAPWGLSTYGEDIFVTDRFNHRIKFYKYDKLPAVITVDGTD